jgi:hypothetical protein
MDADRFGALTRFITTESSRRRMLGGMVSALGAHLAPIALHATHAKNKNKNKNKKRRKKKRKNRTATGQLQVNGFGCVNVGGACLGDSANCCSGICAGGTPKKGKRDTSRCVAHDTGGCQPAGNICNAAGPACTTSTGETGRCFTTTGNAGYCVGNAEIFSCKRDADCQALQEFGQQAACLACANLPGGTACASPDVLPPIPI